MIRITELRLPLEHPPEALKTAAARRLGIPETDIRGLTLFKRSHDARKKNALTFIYSVDVEVDSQVAAADLLNKFADDPKIGPTPDTSYRLVTKAPASLATRPVIVGFGPGRNLRRAGAGANGLPADCPRTRQGRTRTHQGHLGAVAQECAQPGIERAVWRRRRRHLFGRQALQPGQGPAPPRTQGTDRVRQGRRTGGNPLRRQATHRHLPSGRHGRTHAPRDRVARWRNPLPEPCDRTAHRAAARCAG